jgi:LysM repeat protein
MTYDPKFSQKQMYDQYGRSRNTTTSKPNPGKQFADSMKAGGGGRNMSGIGAKPPSFGGGQDNNPNRDESENKSTIRKVYENVVEKFKSYGADEPKDVIVDGKRVYQGPAFRGYDPTTRIGNFGGEYGKKNYFLGMESFPTYPRTDVSPTLPPSTINIFGTNTDNPRLNMFGVNRGFTGGPDPLELSVSPEMPSNMDAKTRALSQGIIPTEVDYTIKKGDTLSQIAQDRGTTVQVLQQLNNIPDSEKDTIFAGDTIKVPVKKAKTYKDVDDNLYVSSGQIMSDAIDPDSQYYQSTVPEKDRTYDEGDFLDNNPQTRQGLMVPQGQQNQPNAVIIEAQRALTDLGYRPMGIDGKAGGGTRRALRKFQKASGLPITGKLDNETITQLAAANAPKYFDPPISASETKKILDSESTSGSILETFSKSDFDKFAAAVADKESSNRYNIKGGYNDGYDGKYQLGKGAKADVKAELTSEAEKNKMNHSDSKQRKAFRKDKKLQEKAFKIYTQKNHEHLTRYSKAYRDMSDKDKLAVLGYAHNQGATAAEEWLYTGVSGSDGFGTKGDEYTSLVKDALGERDTPN